MSTITISGKTYNVEIKNGIRFIDGKNIDDFINSLPLESVIEMAKVGHATLKGENNPQKMANELHQMKHN